MQIQRSKNGYKVTEIGQLPYEWKIVSLKEAAQPGKDTFVDGPFGSDLKVSDYTESGIMLIQLQNVGDGVFYPQTKSILRNINTTSLFVMQHNLEIL